MRRLIAAASAAVLIPALSLASADAAEREYVALNETGMEQVLLKKSWAPGWIGKVKDYRVEVYMKGGKPVACDLPDEEIAGAKSSAVAQMWMTFAPTKRGEAFSVYQDVYQYEDVATAEKAWQDLVTAASNCQGTYTIDVIGDDYRKSGTATVKITVSTAPGMYGQQQLAIVSDSATIERTPNNAELRTSTGQISLWMYDGMAIVNVMGNKEVRKATNKVFSEPQIATIETLALVAIQRYHLAALRAV